MNTRGAGRAADESLISLFARLSAQGRHVSIHDRQTKESRRQRCSLPRQPFNIETDLEAKLMP